MGWPILMKLATEVGLIETFQKPSWFCCLTILVEKSRGGPHLRPLVDENPAFKGVSLDHHKSNK